MPENAKTNPSGLSMALIIVIVVSVVFCCFCFLCTVTAVLLVNNTDFYFEDWEYWSSLIQLVS